MDTTAITLLCVFLVIKWWFDKEEKHIEHDINLTSTCTHGTLTFLAAVQRPEAQLVHIQILHPRTHFKHTYTPKAHTKHTLLKHAYQHLHARHIALLGGDMQWRETHLVADVQIHRRLLHKHLHKIILSDQFSICKKCVLCIRVSVFVYLIRGISAMCMCMRPTSRYIYVSVCTVRFRVLMYKLHVRIPRASPRCHSTRRYETVSCDRC